MFLRIGSIAEVLSASELSALNRIKRNKLIFVYLSLIPILGIYLIVRIIPVCQNIYYSFFFSQIGKPAARFTGLENYGALLIDEAFHRAFGNTTYFAVFVTIFGVIFSLFIALMLAKNTRTNPFYETAYFLPVITSMVPVAIVWKWIYDPTYGLLNYILSFFKIAPIAWLVYPNTALIAIIIMSIWKILGYNMIIFIVGLRNIPSVYLEAAEIDGAKAGQILRKITLPLLRPIILLVFIITTINSYNVFTQVYVMTTGSQGSPGAPLKTMVFEIYENAFRFYKTGYAASEAVILLLIILFLTFVQFGVNGALSKERKHR